MKAQEAVQDMAIINAHKHASANFKALSRSEVCGCFYCLSIFSPKEIEEYNHDAAGDTAICPHCGIDSVIPESSEYEITEEFLADMKKYWFGIKRSVRA